MLDSQFLQLGLQLGFNKHCFVPAIAQIAQWFLEFEFISLVSTAHTLGAVVKSIEVGYQWLGLGSKSQQEFLGSFTK